ncbi:MAG TPA: hypothetical protein PK413_22130, partial [Thermoanaerobaculia bacterium]|nr:hypothetical protein [Thermoanaerobaculia bacterium]
MATSAAWAVHLRGFTRYAGGWSGLPQHWGEMLDRLGVEFAPRFEHEASQRGARSSVGRGLATDQGEQFGPDEKDLDRPGGHVRQLHGQAPFHRAPGALRVPFDEGHRAGLSVDRRDGQGRAPARDRPIVGRQARPRHAHDESRVPNEHVIRFDPSGIFADLDAIMGRLPAWRPDVEDLHDASQADRHDRPAVGPLGRRHVVAEKEPLARDRRL